MSKELSILHKNPSSNPSNPERKNQLSFLFYQLSGDIEAFIQMISSNSTSSIQKLKKILSSSL